MKVTATSKPRNSGLPPLLVEAANAHQAGNFETALPLYRQFLTEYPEHPTALQLLGLLHSQRREFDTAIALMSESLRLFPGQAEVANNLGNALSAVRRFDEAVESYYRAVSILPRYVDAWRNLGLCLLDQGRLDEAGQAFERSLDIRPEDADAWLGAGNVHLKRRQLERAIQCFERALELRPDYAEAHHNMGVCLRMAQRAAGALDHYRSARKLGLDRAEYWQNVGAALVDVREIGAAIDAYREAVRRDPEDIVSHQDLNKLLWEQERLDDHLVSYRTALDLRPDSVRLRLSYAVALNQTGDFAEAEKVLLEGLRRVPDSIDIRSLLGLTLEGQQRLKEALQFHAGAVIMRGSTADHRVCYARALLASGRPEEALAQAREAANRTPFNQRALAYLGLCWRVLGDPREALLNDYENLVRVYEVPVPVGFSNAVEFNRILGDCLQTLHTGKRHPPEQTLRGGTRTHGNLFDLQDVEIRSLVGSLNPCVADYIGRFPESREHPLFARRSAGFRVAASWSVRLQPGGYHTMHVHPPGWISSAYYVQVPAEITGSGAYGGGIKFGEPDIDLGSQGTARRLIQPAVGRLLLFPSYMWHGTVPFESATARMAVAFDVVPGSNSAGGQ